MLKGIHHYISNQSKQMNENSYKFMSGLIISFYEQFIDIDPKLIQFQLKKDNEVYQLAKIDLFRCLNSIPQIYYGNQLNQLIQIAIDDIFNQCQNDFTPSLRHWFEEEDLLLAYENDNPNYYFKLFNSKSLQSAQLMERYEQHYTNYDISSIRY